MKHFAFPCEPVAGAEAMVRAGSLRVSVLTSGLIRIESHPDATFEDRPSQHFWNRRQAVPEFRTTTRDGCLILETEKLELRIPLEEALDPARVKVAIRPGSADPLPLDAARSGNLGGCLRTLDTVRGRWDYKANEPVTPTPGLMSADGWSWIDDSTSLVFDGAGFLCPRIPGGTDWYVLASGRDFAGGLRDYYDAAGRVPLLPKWALGIWWSRWEPYRQSDLERIAGEFETHGVPLSVCVIDMDWHLPGWTGYTWNKDFFPDPRGFFHRMHERGVRACMNLHPAGGVAPKEAAYPAMAAHMGIDPASGQTVAFDITDPRFIEGYFKFLHHPLENDGVDFWWMDWQQGTETSLPGLDPLWYLNHLHALDLARDGSKRPLAFSRWGGWGGHRYPVGFSGDSSRTWETLEFEVELTAQSANTGFGWWSHDIGGFCDGFPDDELYVRWVQFGALSPIFRFHNCGDPTLDYRPWSKEERFREPALAALRLRRKLIPYLYTAARANHDGAPPPCVPMYFGYPENDDARHCPGQYLFGPSMLAAPVTTPANPETGLARKVVWLPPGGWFDFADGTAHPGGRWTARHVETGEIPLFVREGAAIPVDAEDGPEWIVFPGDGESDFYDDDGTSTAFADGRFAWVRLVQRQISDREFETGFAHTGDAAFGSGPFRIRLRGFANSGVMALHDSQGGTVAFTRQGDDWLSAPVTPGTTIRWQFDQPPARRPHWSAARFWRRMHQFHVNSHVVRQMKESGQDFADDLQCIAPFRVEFTNTQMRALVEQALDCGFDWRKENADADFLVWWNHNLRRDFSVRLSRCEWLKYFEVFDCGETSGRSLVISHAEAMRGWSCRVNYCDLALTEAAHDKTGR